jgi:hypothetical protein
LVCALVEGANFAEDVTVALDDSTFTMVPEVLEA